MDSAAQAKAKKAEAARQKNIATTVADYAFVKALSEMHPELTQFFTDLKKIIKASPTGTITDQEYMALKASKNPDGTPTYSWFSKHDADQLAAETAMAQDRLNGTSDYQDSVEKHKVAIKELADGYGLPVNESALDALAKAARYEDWTPEETRAALEKQLGSTANTDFNGKAGQFQTELQEWATKNGMSIPADTLQRMITSGAFGKQSVDDMKNELRKTYLAGSYPAWADKINAGADPYDISAPYRSRVASLLETGDAESVTLNDPLMQRGFQATDAAGKPVQMPIYQFDELVRKDPRWQQTNNAYATYANVAQNVLKTFGFA